MSKLKSFLLNHSVFSVLFLLLFFVSIAIWQSQLSLVEISRVTQHLRLGFKAKPPVLSVKIEPAIWKKLSQFKELAIQRGQVTSDLAISFPSVVQYQGQTFPAKIKLHGKWSNPKLLTHWNFKIRLKKNQSIMGMSEFYLEHPETRGSLSQWVFHQWLRKQGVIAVHYDFIRLVLNGKKLGIYGIQQELETKVAGNNQFPPGPIFNSEAIGPYDEELIIKDKNLRESFEVANQMLHSFRNQKLQTRDVFDMAKLAHYLAATDLFGVSGNEMYFYFNPFTLKLEPVGILGKTEVLRHIKSQMHSSLASEKELLALVFLDPLFVKAYVQELQKISEPAFVSSLLKEFQKELTPRLNILYSEWPAYKFPQEILEKNAVFISRVLNPEKPIQAFYHSVTKDEIVIQLMNLQDMSIEMGPLVLNGHAPLAPIKTVTLSSRGLDPSLKTELVRYPYPQGMALDISTPPKMSVQFQLVGIDKMLEAPVRRWRFESGETLPLEIVKYEGGNVQEFSFIERDERSHLLYALPGQWRIKKNLIIPEGYEFHVGGDTHFILSEGAKIISKSPLRWVGTEENPITVKGEGVDAQGIFIVDALRGSAFRHVSFINLGAPKEEGWELRGALNLYQSPVELSRCYFFNTQSPVALSLVRTSFEVHSSTFENISEHAIQADFSKGKMTDCQFINVGKDKVHLTSSFLENELVSLNRVTH